MKLAEAYVDITARTGRFRRAMGRVRKAVLLTIGVMKALAKTAVIMLIAGAVAAFKFAGAAITQEKAEMNLASALKATGQESENATEKFKKQASAMQLVTTFGDEAILQMMTMATNLGVQSDQVTDVTKAAIGLSTALGVDLNSAMKMAALAVAGETTLLRRYIPELRSTTDLTKQLAIIQKVSNAGWRQAQDETQTTSGALKQMWNALGDVSEKIGDFLLPMLKKIGSYMADNAAAIGSFITGALTRLWNIGLKVFSTLTHVVQNWKKYLELAMIGAAFGIVVYVMTLKHWFTVVIPDLLKWFLRNWKDIFTTLWNFTTSVFSNMWTNIKNFFTNVWAWLTGTKTNWKWTGLLDGFESTLKELPKIADREIGLVEKTLKGKMLKLNEELAQGRAKTWEKFKPQVKEDAKELEAIRTDEAEAGLKLRGKIAEKEASDKKSVAFRGLAETWKRIQVAAIKAAPKVGGQAEGGAIAIAGRQLSEQQKTRKAIEELPKKIGMEIAMQGRGMTLARG